MDSSAAVALCSPGYVVYVAEREYQHDMRVGALKNHVADAVKKQFKNELGVGGEVDQGYENIAGHVDASDDKDQCSFCSSKDICKASYWVYFQIYTQDIVDDQCHE